MAKVAFSNSTCVRLTWNLSPQHPPVLNLQYAPSVRLQPVHHADALIQALWVIQYQESCAFKDKSNCSLHQQPRGPIWCCTDDNTRYNFQPCSCSTTIECASELGCSSELNVQAPCLALAVPA